MDRGRKKKMKKGPFRISCSIFFERVGQKPTAPSEQARESQTGLDAEIPERKN
jgi:hypothetical protein